MPPISVTGQFASKARHDVAFAKTEFSADDITALTPAPDVKAAGIKIIKRYVGFLGCIGWFHTLVDALCECIEGQPFHPLRSKIGGFTHSGFGLLTIRGRGP